MHRRRRILLAVLIAALPSLLFLRAMATLSTVPARLRDDPAARYDVALVLSGDPANLRTLAAVRLLAEGRVGRILISGHGYGGDSAEVLAGVARAAGAPPEKIEVEGKATSTVENMLRSRALLRDVGPSVLVITSTLHAKRAGLLAERWLGVRDVRVMQVDTGRTQPRHYAGEVLKTWRVVARAELPLSALFE